MRASGVILPITSLPSKHGIGTLGKAAHEFVEFLAAAGQTYWQILPMGNPVGGESPYQTDSAFSCNPMWIDLEPLVEKGLIDVETANAYNWGSDPARVDYSAVRPEKEKLLRTAWENFSGSEDESMAELRAQFEDFCREQSSWLDDYCLYASIKESRDGESWTEWPENLKMRDPETLKELAEKLKDEIGYHAFCQFLFFKQWDELHDKAKAAGVKILGDIPIYVPLDSCDVWAHKDEFQLDEDGRPTRVAGCPPDYFSEEGQLWGNPLYDWDHMRDTGYRWWIERIGHLSKLVDALRIDHFRGIESYYSIAADAETAKEGVWVKGPGMDLIGRLTAWFSGLEMVAEDLGLLTWEVHQMLEESGLPGMKVLEFAFTADADSDYLPHKYPENCICYVGTHDNETLEQWLASCPEEDLEFAKKYAGLNKEEGYRCGIIRLGAGSNAKLFMAQIQDYLGLGAEARMNEPGVVSDMNWSWRLVPGQASDELAEEMHEIAKMYGRI